MTKETKETTHTQNTKENVADIHDEANKLFKSVVDTEKKANNTGARIAVLLHKAIISGQIDKAVAVEFSKGTTRQRANAIINKLCTDWSEDYCTLYKITINKEAKEKKSAEMSCKAVRKAMTRSLYIAAMAADKNLPLLAANSRGNIVTNVGTEEQEELSLRSAEKKARQHFGRTGQGIVKGKHENSEVLSIPLNVALNTVLNKMSGRAKEDLGKEEKELASEVMLALIDVFEIKDAKAIEQLYKEAA